MYQKILNAQPTKAIDAGKAFPKLNIQNNNLLSAFRKKCTIIFILAFTTILIAVASSGRVNAQTSPGTDPGSIVITTVTTTSTVTATPCLTDVLDISTGINPLASDNVLSSGSRDTKWHVVGLSADDLAVPGAGIPSYEAWVITRDASMVNAPGICAWISFIKANNFTTSSTGSYLDTFARTFKTCVCDSITFNAKVGCDDGITNILIDGVSIYGGQPAAPNVGNFNSWTNVDATVVLAAGTHTITVAAMNYPFGPTITNYHGFALDGKLTALAGTSPFVSEDSACGNYVCSCECGNHHTCDDHCFWRVTGNTIHSGNNLFGTLSNDDIKIITDNTERSVIKADGKMGIKETAPTTTLDVNCVPVGSAPSGLRFENLPNGKGYELVVDPATGYVYAVGGKQKNLDDLQNEVDDLKQQIQALKTQLGQNSDISGGNSLSVSPNPTSGDITATYVISGNNVGSITITDNLGRMVVNVPVQNNSGTINITIPSSVTSNTLIVSLVVDGSVVASQKEVLINK